MYINIVSLAISTSFDGKEQIMPDLSPVQINHGIYFGEAIGYNQKELFITTEKTTYRKSSSIHVPELTDILNEVVTKREIWDALYNALNWDAFKALPSIIGQPDARDQGGEYVEIQFETTSKRVDIEYGASIPKIDELLKVLRGYQEALSIQFD